MAISNDPDTNHWTYAPKHDALKFALESFRQNEVPPKGEAIVDRAKQFETFLAL
jgi:hypothetical protein